MVVLTGAACTVWGSAIHATTIVARGAMSGILGGAATGVTLGGGMVLKGTATVATATAAAGAAGGIFGSVVATLNGAPGVGALAGAASGAAAGASTAAAVTSIALNTAGILSGPIGLAVLGAEEDEHPGFYTFDCWKPVLHDENPEPSKGKLLRDVCCDARVSKVTIVSSDNEWAGLVVRNVWDEQFRIEYLHLPNGLLCAHAVRV